MPNQRRLFTFALAVLCCCSALTHGAPVVRSDSRYSIKFWDTDTDDRLPQASVLCMVQSRDGYLWLGTLLGLVRFDGARFTVFDESNSPELKDSRIVFLFEDSRGTLWVGTENSGIVMMRDGRFHAVPELAAGGVGRRLRAACEDASGALWFYCENALWRHVNRQFTPFTLLPMEEGRAIFQQTNGPLWIATVHHQYAVSGVPEGSLVLPVDDRQTKTFRKLDALLSSRGGGYWRLADGVIERCADNGVTRRVAQYPSFPQVSSACEDHEGNLIVGTRGGGVFRSSTNGEITWLTATNGLSWPYVLSVLVDREGTLWIGTDGGGLYRVQKKIFDALEPFLNWTVSSVTEGEGGGLWIASNGNGIGYWSDTATNQFYPGFSFKAIFADRERRVWVSLSRGPLYLSLLKDGRFEGIAPPGLIQHPVQAMHQDRAGRVWFGSEGGLVRWETNEWKVFTRADGLAAQNVTAIADDAEGNLWVGTRRGGIHRWRQGEFTAVQASREGRGDDISALLIDREGVLWAATFASGLIRFQNGKWTRYTTREGLASNNLGYLLEDDAGNLWIGSNDGLLRVARQALNDFAAGLAQSIPCHAYDKTDGLPTRECSSGSQPGAWRGHDGQLWFSTIKGVAALNPAQLSPNTNPPLVTIESVAVDDALVSADNTASAAPRTLTLKPNDERLEIQYSSLNLSAPDRARFRYWLEGYEKDWTEAGKARAVTYRKLPPGQYTFHVTASNEDGVWNEDGASLPLVVEPPPPPLWKRWWFITATTICLVTIIVAIVHYFSTQKLQRQVALLRQQEALEKERARIARDIHDQVGASLTQVALLGELVETDKDLPEEIQGHAQQISQTARETTRALDEIVWTVNPQNDTLEGLVNYICKYAQDYLAVAGLRYRFDLPAALPERVISPDVRHNVFLASKEAITNVVRHAKATAAWVRLKIERDSFTVEVEDNGRGVAGLDPNAPQTRNGLKNMRKRMEDVGGTFTIKPGDEGGALVCLKVPLPTHKNDRASIT